ncbi:MAG TPA: (2Fe-2S)-binding protein [Candidatus Binataceae bacterium]|nr:(2Fe-2S)-binding protein [Candidatus Binataceae bacterium]
MNHPDQFPPPSPIVSAYERLRAIHPNWYVEWGRRDYNGWIPGEAFTDAFGGPFHELLERIGARMQTADRRIIAGSFVLRFGWSAGVAVAPFLLQRCVPDVRLENVSLKFNRNTLFEKVSLHAARGAINEQPHVDEHSSASNNTYDGGSLDLTSRERSIESPDPNNPLLAALRATLVEQAQPVVNALYAWSHFSKRAMWGQIASSWGAQFSTILGQLDRHLEALDHARLFFDSPGFLVGARPKFYVVEHLQVTRIYQRRATCCLYFKLPKGHYCAGCPLISQDERVRRNKEWIEKNG